MGKGILAGASGGGTNIPVTSDPADNVQIWIDPNEEDQNEQFYTKTETENYVKITAALKDLSNVDSSALLAAIESAGGGGAKIATGSYVGTGTYEKENPTVILTEFRPKLILIFNGDGKLHYTTSNYSSTATVFSIFPTDHLSAEWAQIGTKVSDNMYLFLALESTEDGNYQFKMYDAYRATNQANYAGATYRWVAIG